MTKDAKDILTAWAEWACRQPVGMTKPNDLSPPVPGLRVAGSEDEANAIANQDAEKDWITDMLESMTEDERQAFRRYKSVEIAIEKLETLAGSKLPAGKLRSLLIHVYWSGGEIESWQGVHWPMEAAMPRTLMELGWHPSAFLAATISRLVEMIPGEDEEAA